VLSDQIVRGNLVLHRHPLPEHAAKIVGADPGGAQRDQPQVLGLSGTHAGTLRTRGFTSAVSPWFPGPGEADRSAAPRTTPRPTRPPRTSRSRAGRRWRR